MADDRRIRDEQQQLRELGIVLGNLAPIFRELANDLPELAAVPSQRIARLLGLAADCGRLGDQFHETRRGLEGIARNPPSGDEITKETA